MNKGDSRLLREGQLWVSNDGHGNIVRIRHIILGRLEFVNRRLQVIAYDPRRKYGDDDKRPFYSIISYNEVGDLLELLEMVEPSIAKISDRKTKRVHTCMEYFLNHYTPMTNVHEPIP